MDYAFRSLYNCHVAFDMDKFRAALRAERVARGIGRDALATQIGVAKSTIQSAEMGPDMPGIETVAKIVEALQGLTLAQFFARLEVVKTTERSVQDPPAAPLSSNSKGSADEPIPPPSEQEYRAAIRVLSAIAGREAERADATHPRLSPSPPDAPPLVTRDRVRRVRRTPARTRKRQPRK